MTNIHSPINYASRPGAVVGHIDQVLGLKGHHIGNIMQFSGKHKISIGYFMYFNFIFFHEGVTFHIFEKSGGATIAQGICWEP